MKKNKAFIIAATIVLLIGIYPAFQLFSRLSYSDSKTCWDWSPAQKSVFPKDKLVQSFSPEKDGLRAIALKPLLENDLFDPAKTEFVFKNKQGQAVFSKTVRHFDMEMESNKLFELSLPVDTFQKGGKYFLEITPSVKKISGHNLGFWETNGDCYAGGLKVDEEKQKNTDLAVIFKYSKGNFSESLNTLFERMVQYKPLWLKGKAVLPLLLGIFILGTLFFLIAIAIKIRNSQDD